MSESDPHAPTNAGPTPEPEPAPEPTPVVSAAEATLDQPPGSADFGASAPYTPPPAAAPAVDPNPERKVGAAFAGGVAVAFLLRRMAHRRHR